MISGVGTAWAEEEPFYTLDGTITTGGNSNYAQDGGGLTQEGISWSVTGNTTTSPWRIGGKNLTDVNRDVYSKTAMGAAISKIELEIGSITLSNVNSIKLIVASNSDFSTEIETIEKTSITANTTLTFEPSGSEWAKDAYYKFVFNVDAGSSNSYIQLKSIKFFEATASASPLASIALSGTYPTNFYVGDAFSHEGMTVTATYEDASTNDVTNSAIFSGYDMDNAGSQTVTVSYTENDITKKAQYGITVSERPKFTVTFSDGGSVTEESAGAGVTLPSREAIGDYTFAGWSETDVAVETTVAPTIIPAGSYNPTANVTLYPVYTRTEGGGAVVDEWVEIFEVPTDGYYAICSDSYFMKAVIDSKRFANGDKSPNIEDGKLIDAPADDCIWNIYKADSYYRIKYENSFASATGSNNQGKLVDSDSEDFAKWTITYSNGFVIENVGMASANKNKTLRNNGSYGWASYGSSTGDAPRLFKKTSIASSTTYYFSSPVAAAVERPVITFAENPFLFSTTATITCATEGATIKYSFDGENWNDYSEALTITATTTIHAKATKGNDESNIATAIVTKNLAEPTVAISGDLTLDLNGETDVPAGTLTAAVTYNETAVDGATVTWSGNNAAVATINAETGAVTIKSRGTVTFTATYAGNDDFAEATATKTITVTDSKVPGTKNNPYTVAQAIEAIDNSVGVTGVYATGIVSKIVTAYNSQYGNISYNISVDGTTEKAQLQAYRGKSYNGENFTSEDDIQVGDVVVIYGNLKKYNSTYEFEQDNQLVSRTENSASDLTKKGDITLDFKNGNTVATLTDYFTTSSTGAITYTVADETVIENADELISALKVGTTTVTVSQAATLSYKAGEITINVTVQDTREAATTIPAINIETLKVDDVGTLSVTNPVKADEGVTFSFASSDDNVLMVENGEYAALAVGTVTVTVTATPSNTNLYKPVVANFEVTVEADVKTNTEIAIDDASGSTVYGTPKNVDFVITDGYNGELSYTIDNAAIADVEIGASAITFTPKAVGIAVITISAPETATFNAAENVQYTLTVTAPEGSTEAAVSSVILFNETFDKCEGSGGRDGEFTGNVGTSSTTGNLDEEWTTIGSNGASQCIKLGTGKATGSVETSNITLSGSATLTFSAAGWGDTSTNTIQVSAEGATLSGDVEVTLANGVWNSYTVNITEATGSVSITFTMKRGFLDDVVVTKEDAAITAKLNASGYATFCSQYPLDFTTTNGYTAWQIKAISGETITFEKITGAIKGGQGILLKGEADATVTLASKDASTMLDGNLLYGTTAPTYVTDDEYFGLSGNKFVKINAGTVPAGKALLPASAIPAGARELTFVFEDGQTTGIESLNPALSKGADTIYDLQGRKVAQPTKGLYIKNGKKVVMK